MDTTYMVSCVLLMAGVTYVIRMLPIAMFQRQFESRFVHSSLTHVLYVVPSAMTLLQILYSAGGTTVSAVELLVAMVFVFRGKGLPVITLGVAAAALFTQQLLLAGLLQNFV